MSKKKHKLSRRALRQIERMVRFQKYNPNDCLTEDTGPNQYYKSAGSAGLGTSYMAAVAKAMSSVAISPKNANTPVMLPPIAETLHVSAYDISENNSFHMRVFRARHEGIDYTTVNRACANEGEVSRYQLAFYSEADRDTFDAWQTAYEAKFSGQYDQHFPPPLDNHYEHWMRTNFIRSGSNVRAHDPEDEMLKQWLWLLDNAQGEVRHAGAFWFFELDEDASLFRLAFS